MNANRHDAASAHQPAAAGGLSEAARALHLADLADPGRPHPPPETTWRPPRDSDRPCPACQQGRLLERHAPEPSPRREPQPDAAPVDQQVLRRREQPGIQTDGIYVDSLTALGNRHAFDLHLRQEWRRAQDRVDSVIVTIDLHGLDALNDAYGSATGDEALREFAQATRAAAPSTDITARIARHQFGVLLIRRGDRATPMFIGRLRDALAGRAAHLSVSVGHASLRRSSSPADALNRAALASLPAIRG